MAGRNISTVTAGRKPLAEIEPASLDRMRRFAHTLATQVQRDILDYLDCINLIERAAVCSPRYAHLPDARRDALAWWAVMEFDAAIHAPEMAAAFDIRFAAAPLLSARAPRGQVLLAAYRAANGRMSSVNIEKTVTEEIAMFMSRVRSRP